MPSKTQTSNPDKESAATPSPGKLEPVAKFRLRVSVGEAIAIGPGKVALLEAIAETGSITAAAKRLGMSYRRAWMLLDDLNRTLEKPAVDSAKGGPHGGGSFITDTGRQVIELYRRIEVVAAQACEADLTRLVKLIAR